MAQQIQLRNDNTAQWEYINPVLAVGEIGVDTTLGKFKIGNGTSTWTQLQFQSASIADFVFAYDDNAGDSTITVTDHDMVIQTVRDNDSVGSDCDINIEAADDVFIRAYGDDIGIYASDEVFIRSSSYDGQGTGNGGGNSHEWTFTNNGHIKFPDGTIQTTSSQGILPLPDFLNWREGQTHLPDLNTHFGWDSAGLWFTKANESMGDNSYPVFTDFTIPQDSAVVVEFDVNINDECSDVGVCIYSDEANPQWSWDPNLTRIAAQFDCTYLKLLGRTNEVTGEVAVPTNGLYRVVFSYNPAASTDKVTVSFKAQGSDQVIDSLSINEALPAGPYRIGFAADQNSSNAKTYMTYMSISINGGNDYGANLTSGNSAVGLSDIKTRIWGYPSNNAIAIMPETDNESIALKSSDAAAIRWHVRNNTTPMQLLSATVTAGDGYQVVFTINEQDSVPATGSGKYYQINCPNNSAYNGAFIAVSATKTTLTFIYESDPGVFDATSASISQPSVYSQFEVDSTGAHVKVADWSSGPGGYAHYWNFQNDGSIEFPNQPSNNRTGNGEVLKFGNPTSQSIITGGTPSYTSPNAQRIVVAGQDGTAGDGYDGEGGDIYLWAGRGGGTNGNGGDIKVDGGEATGTADGGYVKIRGGYSPNGSGGFVNIDAGSSSTGSGGNIQITAGSSNNGENTYGGAVQIYSGYSNTNGLGGNIYLTTQSGGKIFLQPAADHVYVGSESPGNRVAQVEDLAYTRVAVPTSSLGVEGHRLDMIADDGTYHYYCTGTYDGTTHIWKRIAWSADTWGV